MRQARADIRGFCGRERRRAMGYTAALAVFGDYTEPSKYCWAAEGRPAGAVSDIAGSSDRHPSKEESVHEVEPRDQGMDTESV